MGNLHPAVPGTDDVLSAERVRDELLDCRGYSDGVDVRDRDHDRRDLRHNDSPQADHSDLPKRQAIQGLEDHRKRVRVERHVLP